MVYLIEATATFRRDTLGKLSFVFLMWLDVALTLWAVSLGLEELNPHVKTLLNDLPLLFCTKVIGAAVVAWIVPGKLLFPATAFMILVIGWNIKELMLYII